MKIFYGWIVVAAGFVITCIGLGTAMSLGVFLQPISIAMGWSRTEVSSAAVLTFLFMGFGSFFWGAVSDRFGTRSVLLCGGLLLGSGLIAASRVTQIWQFQLLWGICGGLAAGAFFAPLTAIASRWFTRHRSLAVALITSGMGLGSMAIGPMARAIMTVSDWRTAMFDLGLLAYAVVLPTSLLVRGAPAEPGVGSGLGADDRGFTVAQALRTPQFAAVAGTFFACCVAHSGPIFHMISYAIDCGVPAMTAATVFGTAGVASLFGRIVFGLLADRLGAKPTLVGGLLLQAVSIQVYYFVRTPEAFYSIAMVFGLSYGGVMPLYAILVREYFGARIMGTVFGAVVMTSTIGMAIGPWAGGYIFDHLGGYGWLYIGSCAIGLGAATIAFVFRPPVAVARFQIA
ncbi:MAG: MFS transporter [Rhodospirillales bacterium]